MPTKVQCPNSACRTVYTVPEGAAGRTSKCKRCGARISLPAVGAASGLPAKIDRYEVRELLGAGAFGSVYRAFDPRLQRDVALKVLRPEATASTEAVERFLREARSAARLLHPHIVPVHDTGHSGGVYFIASALIKGRQLAAAVPPGGMDPRRAAELTAQLASALAYAHKQGILHRDVKPQNTLLDEEGSLHLVDFGLARWSDEDATRLTQGGGVLGTPAYMAPEQAAGDAARVGPASDLYGAGAVLYHLLTGRPPFEGGQLATLVYQIVHTEPAPPSRCRPGLDAKLEAICLKALAKDPARRYGSGDEMATALRKWLGVLTPAYMAPEALPLATPMATLPPPIPPLTEPTTAAGAVTRPSVWDRETVLNDPGPRTLPPRPERRTGRPQPRRKSRSAFHGLLWGAAALVVTAGLAAAAAFVYLNPPRSADAWKDVRADFQACSAAIQWGKGSEPFIRDTAPRRLSAWETAARAGVPEAQYLVARSLDLGAGKPKDDKAAADWYRKAADQGLALAQNNLGAYYHDGLGGLPKDDKAAVEWYRKAADQGLAQAENNLGGCYLNGTGKVPRDEKAAAEWYRKAADQGFAPAQTNLGECYQNGVGVDKDLVEAVKWYRKAADQGYALGQTDLGWCCFNGAGGLPKDEKTGAEWFRKAADQGDGNGQTLLGWCYLEGKGVRPDSQQGVEWYRKAADQGFAEAQFDLALCYENGKGMDSADPKAAVEWYRKAADQGLATARNNLGWCYERGAPYFDQADTKAAYDLYLQAANQNDDVSQFNVGRFYRDAIAPVLASDPDKAREWFQKAADNGNEAAKEELKQLDAPAKP